MQRRPQSSYFACTCVRRYLSELPPPGLGGFRATVSFYKMDGVQPYTLLVYDTQELLQDSASASPQPAWASHALCSEEWMPLVLTFDGGASAADASPNVRLTIGGMPYIDSAGSVLAAQLARGVWFGVSARTFRVTSSVSVRNITLQSGTRSAVWLVSAPVRRTMHGHNA